MKRKKAPYRLLYNNDGMNVASLPSPWHEKGEPFREEFLRASIEEVADHGVDAYLLCPGFGWVPWWQSEVEPGFYDWWRRRTGLEVEGRGGRGYEKYISEGGDMVRVLVQTCRCRGMAPFVTFRLNDTHYLEHYEARNQDSLMACRFYAEHPEWHIDPGHSARGGYSHLRGMDWAVPAVREYKSALVGELARNYDLAGIELDFLRDHVLFRDDFPEAERVEVMTGFVAGVRAALDACPGEHRRLCVRMPLDLAACPAIGIDPERLYEAGVDMFNLSGWYHTTQRTDIAKMRHLLPGAAIYLEMSHSTGAHRYFLEERPYSTDGDPRTSDHQFYTTAALALARGADGLSLFNFAYYREGAGRDIPVIEPPFHVLPKLADRRFLSRQASVYMLGRTFYKARLPRRLEPGKTEALEIDMLEEAGPGKAPARLRLHLREPWPEKLGLEVVFNGRGLEPTRDVSRLEGNPFDGMISPRAHRRAWLIPRELIRDGLNELRLSGASVPVELIWVDCLVPGAGQLFLR